MIGFDILDWAICSGTLRELKIKDKMQRQILKAFMGGFEEQMASVCSGSWHGDMGSLRKDGKKVKVR